METLECNFEEVYKEFLELSEKNMKKCLTAGIKTALKAVKDSAVRNLRSVIKNANKKNPLYNDTLQSGVRITGVKATKKGTIFGKVTIFSNGKSGSGSYRLAILESGSYKKGERFQKINRNKLTYLKKPRSLGVLPAKHFFKKTIDEKDSYFQNTMDKAIAEAVEQTNRYFK